MAEMHDAVFQHVKTTGHRELVLADESIVRLVGIACAQCETLWNAPHPGGLLSMCRGRVRDLWQVYGAVASRRDHLEREIERALDERPQSDKSVWDWLRSRTGVGW